MEERILSEETINAFREYLVLEEKSTATVEKYLRDVRAFQLSDRHSYKAARLKAAAVTAIRQWKI